MQAKVDQFRRIYDAELAYVWASLRRLGVAPADLEDVAQVTLLSVYEKLDEYDVGRPIRPWLFGFAFRTASDYRKKAYRRRELPTDGVQDVAPPSSRRGSAEHELVRREERAMIVEALDAIPIERSAVLVAVDIDGRTAPEAAEMLGIPLNTVYSRLRVAREELTAAVRRIQTRKR